MGLTRKDESILVRLRSNIRKTQENKKQLLQYIQKLKRKCENREITYSEYERLLNKKRDGKTLQQWLSNYDSYIKQCKNRLNKEQSKLPIKKITVITISILIISFMFFSLLNFTPTGLVVQEQVQEYTEPLNLEFNESSTYEWIIQNPGNLTSVKMSGEVLGEGTVKIYLEDKLVFDSSKPQTNKGFLTGFAVDETTTSPSPSETSSDPAPAESTSQESTPEDTQSPSETSSESSSNNPSERAPAETSELSDSEEIVSDTQDSQSADSTETSSEEQEVSSQPQEQMPPVSSEPIEKPTQKETIPEVNTTDVEEISEEFPLKTTNITENENVTLVEKAIPTEEITNASVSEPVTPSEVGGFEFVDVCEETCQLSLNKENYTIKVEIDNASVFVDEIKYKILSETFLSEDNLTLTNLTFNESVTNLTDVNITRVVTNTSSQIVIGQPVKWVKKIELDKPGKVKVKLPKQAENITVRKVKDSYSEEQGGSSQPQKIPPASSEANHVVTSVITGRVTSGILSRVASITGNVVSSEESVEDVEVTIDDTGLEYEIEYETPGPEASEKVVSDKEKKISVFAPDELGYTNVLAYSYLEREVKRDEIAIYHDETGERVKIKAFDLNRNGLVDYVEWTVPHLSEQNYSLVIEITGAEHLDENREFVSDIYDEVRTKDNVWTYTIPEGDFVRVVFEENLTKDNDIKVYARGSGSVEVYAKDSEELITSFSNISGEGWYRVYLDNLEESSHDTFDLKVFGSVSFDYIVDPNLNLEIFGDINDYYTSVILKTNVNANASYDAWDIISSPPPSDYSEFYSNISDGTSEYHLVVDTWNASENPRDLYLIYYIDSAQTGSLNFSWESLDGTEYYMNFTYYGTDSSYTTPVATRDMRDHTGYNASISSAQWLYVMIDYSRDETPPTPTITSIGEDSSSPYSTSDTSPTLLATTDENAYCRASTDGDESYAQMSDDIICSGGGTQSHTCNFGTLSESSSTTFYVACNDTGGNENSAANNDEASAEIDASPPVQSSHVPANESVLSETSVMINFTLNELGDCKWSLTDQAYHEMSNDCVGDGTTSINCSVSGLSDGEDTVFIACRDDTDVYTNNDTSDSNTELTYYVDSSSISTCRKLTQPNTQYNLTNNIVDNNLTDNCINITAENITLDCKGFYIQSDDNYSGVYSDQLNTTIKNCNISMGNGSGGHGIYLFSSNNSYLENNTLNSQHTGLYLNSEQNVSITQITANLNDYGIYVTSSSNSITQITTNFNDYGIYVTSSSNNNLTNITTYSSKYYAIHLFDSNNNSFDDMNIWNCSSSGSLGCIRIYDSNYNKFSSGLINKSEGNGIIIHSEDPSKHTSHNLFKDINISNIESTSVKLSCESPCDGINNTFLNTSYENESVDSDLELIRKWYYRAYVNDSNNNNVENANVTAFNVSGDYNFNITTDATGYTSQITITEYVNNGTTVYYSNYTIYADNITHSDSHPYNVTLEQNNYKDVFTLDLTPGPTEINACQELDTANTEYIMTADITNNSLSTNCIIIAAENITLNCAGHSINSDDAYSGIYSDQFNTTIHGCTVNMSSSSGGYGIELEGANYTHILNNTLDSQYCGLYLRSTHDTRIESITANSNNWYGILLSLSSNNTLTNITANSNGHGIYFISNSNNNTLTSITANSNDYGILLSSNSNNNTLTNIVANSNNLYGILLSSSSNNILYSNNMSNNTYNFYISGTLNKHFDNDIDTNNIVDYSYKIYYNYSISDHTFDATTAPDAGTVVCAFCDNVTYKDLNLSHHNYYGIQFFNTNNSRIENITANSNRVGIYFSSGSNNNILTNITANSNNWYGIHFSSGSNNNTLTSITANSNNLYGIYLFSSFNNTLTSITANSNDYGIYIVSNSNNNTLTSITANSNRAGIYIVSSSNNKITNSSVWNCSSIGSYACINIYESDYNTFTNNRINKSSNYGIWIISSGSGDHSSHNVFRDTNMTNIEGTTVFLDDASGSQNLNNTFINCTYNNESVDTNSELFRKWYYKAYVNDTEGNPVLGANITAFNTTGDYNFNITTDATGYTSQTTITEYVNNGTTVYYSNYTIYADNITHSDSHTYNVTLEQNNYKDVFTLNLESAPEIYAVYNETSAVDINENTFTEVIINFSVYDPNGFSNLNSTSSMVNLSFSGEDVRENVSCYPYEQSGDYANYTCNVSMWWWDTNGTWTINAYIEDNDGYSAINTSSTQEVGETRGFTISPSIMLWPGMSPGMTNITSISDPMILNNTGNIAIFEIEINSTNLRGEENNNTALWAGNFSVGNSTGGTPPAECGGTSMSEGVFTKVESAFLERGNYTINDGTGQEELYFCLKVVGSDLTVAQAYSTSQEGAWTIRIAEVFIVAFTLAKKKKKGKKKYKIPTSIFVKELGGLEALVKYLKENLHLNYKEIAEEINRDERTVWTAYNKAVEKVPESLDIISNITIDLSIFKSELTPLAAAISHLKNLSFRNKEIASLINRDERNVWTIYNRIKDRLPEKETKEEVREDVEIPISIFTKELGGLEAVVKYLKENLGMRYCEISKLLKRDERTVWTAYNKAKVKKPVKFRARGITIPLKIFTEEKTVLEAIIGYLKGLEFSYHKIGELLHRDERNVWIIYNRGVKK